MLKIRFCNPSTFGPLVRDYVASLHSLNEVVLHAWAETHIPASRIGDWQDKLRKMGWRAAMSPSLAPSVSSAPKAGTAVMTRMHIASTNASDRAGAAARPDDFAAATLRIAGGEVLIGATYLTHGLGISGPNVGRLASIVAFLAHITFPWCLLGDWNVEPHELRDAGFLHQLGGALIWTPSDTRFTCGLPPVRLLDYAVISPSFQVLARSMTAIHDLPWHAHLGLEITLTREAKVFQCQELALPRPFDQPAAVKTKPDQSSKRSRRKAAFLNRVSKSQERRAAGPSAEEEGDGSALFRSLPEDTRDRIWHTIHSGSDSESPPVPAHVLASQSYAFNPQESSSLGRLWGRWATTMEKFFCLDLRIPSHEWPRFTGRGLGAQTRSTTWGRCKPPRFSRHGLTSGWWGAVSKYLLLYLTCSQRNHGDAQQQAACAALHARARSVPPSLDMDAEHEALWGFRLSDIRSITHPVLWGMYREATDRTHNLRAKAISEARRGIDDWVRQHAEKGNKRLHAWVRGDTPSSVEFQVDGNTTSDPSRIFGFQASVLGRLLGTWGEWNNQPSRPSVPTPRS